MSSLQVGSHTVRVKGPFVFVVILRTFDTACWISIVWLLAEVEHIEEDSPQLTPLVVRFHEDDAKRVFVDIHDPFGEGILAKRGREPFDYPHLPFFPVN